MSLPITGCECRFRRHGQCTRPGGAERAETYMFPPQLGGSHTDCNAKYYGGLESCGDREIRPDSMKKPPKNVAGRWRFGIIYSTNYSRPTPDGAKPLEYWSWTNGAQGRDVVLYYAQAIAWVEDRGKVPGLEEISPEEMARTLAVRKNQRAYTTLSEFGLSATQADRCGCSIYHSDDDWAVRATPALVRALS